MTSKFVGWPRKTIRHIFYSISSFVHHFITINEIKLELWSGNALFGSKSMILCPVWPWNLTVNLKNYRAPLLCHFKLCASFCSHLLIKTEVTVQKCHILGSKLVIFFVLCDLEIWGMTLKSKKAPVSFYFKLCASFHSHQWNQTGVTVRKHPIQVKIDDFASVWPWNLTDDLEKQ